MMSTEAMRPTAWHGQGTDKDGLRGERCCSGVNKAGVFRRGCCDSAVNDWVSVSKGWLELLESYCCQVVGADGCYWRSATIQSTGIVPSIAGVGGGCKGCWRWKPT